MEAVSDEANNDEETLGNMIATLGNDVTPNDYIAVDDQVKAKDITREEQEKVEDEQTEIQEVADEEDDVAIEKPTAQEAAPAMTVLTNLYYHNNFVCQTQFHAFQKAFMNMQMQAKKQSKITDYFKK